MKKKLIAAVTLTALLVAALGAAMASPGTGSDPFVTLSYLTGTYYKEVEADMLEQAQKSTAATEKAAFDKLDALAGSYLAQAGGQEYADDFLRMTLSRNDRLDLPTGASLLFEAGQVELVFASGSFVDVTDGSTVTAGGKLTAGHHYVAAEDTACSITAVSDAVYLSVRGYYNLESSGMTYTPFTDLKADDWYYSSVRFAYDNELFKGLTATTFSPNTNMNRAMLATVLSRMAGIQGPIPAVGFTDVKDGDWYSDAVNWAAAVGIVNGMGDGTFAPNANVTREQMAAMLYRYARDWMGIEVSASGDLSAFSDRAKVSSWAVESVSWAVDNGIMTGYTDGTLGPGGTATRAQVATMLQRFSNLI